MTVLERAHKVQWTDGVLVVDKPKEWTSHDVCAFIRSRFGIEKVGHAGTLDPIATGVLLVLLGRTTKKAQDFVASDKVYQGIGRLGLQTDSHDISGKVTTESDWHHVTTEQLKNATIKFTGDLEQLPPMVSALKHKGRRLYELARKGVTVERAKRPVTVHEFEIGHIELPDFHFVARVSKGTYVRTLINDLGEALGTHATLTELRRTRSGVFDLTSAVTIDELRQTKREDFGRFVKSAYTT